MIEIVKRGKDLVGEINNEVVSKESLALWWLGGSGFVLKGSNEKVIYIDPYLSDWIEEMTKGREDEHIRLVPPPLIPEEVTNAHLILCTHDHPDHIDHKGLPRICKASSQSKVVVPPIARKILVEKLRINEERIITPWVNEPISFNGLSITSIPSKHEEFDFDPQFGYPYVGYIIKVDGITLYHSGDTIPYDGLVENLVPHQIDIALLPINGRDERRHRLNIVGNFTYQEAADLVVAAQVKVVIPMHYGTFEINNERVENFRDYITRKYPQQKYHLLNYGERFIYTKEVA